MKKYSNIILLSLFILFFAGFSVEASAEEVLRWRTVEIDCFEDKQTGIVHFSAKTDGQRIGSVTLKAFGKSFSLRSSHLKKIRSFPLDSLKVTHEAGYEKPGDYTVLFKLARTTHDKSRKPHHEEAVISISKGKGLAVAVFKDPPAEALLTTPYLYDDGYGTIDSNYAGLRFAKMNGKWTGWISNSEPSLGLGQVSVDTQIDHLRFSERNKIQFREPPHKVIVAGIIGVDFVEEPKFVSRMPKSRWYKGTWTKDELRLTCRPIKLCPEKLMIFKRQEKR